MKGIDYTDSNKDIQTLIQADYKFVCRYLPTSVWKGITRNEINRLHKVNLKIVLAFETTTNRCLSGQEGGVEDATRALSLLLDLNITTPQVIYFCVDNDFNQEELMTVQEYFKGIAQVIDISLIGAYGGYNTISTLFDNNLITYGWQTLAWSQGRWDPRAQLRQTTNNQDLDEDISMSDDFGGF